MAVDSYMLFQMYDNSYLAAESQVDFSASKDDKVGSNFIKQAGKVFEVDTFSFDVEQTINMSSQSSGAGAGKIAFNPFKITRKIDKASSALFQMACQGKTFQNREPWLPQGVRCDGVRPVLPAVRFRLRRDQDAELVAW